MHTVDIVGDTAVIGEEQRGLKQGLPHIDLAGIGPVVDIVVDTVNGLPLWLTRAEGRRVKYMSPVVTAGEYLMPPGIRRGWMTAMAMEHIDCTQVVAAGRVMD